jgi:hypothetical protein
MSVVSLQQVCSSAAVQVIGVPHLMDAGLGLFLNGAGQTNPAQVASAGVVVVTKMQQLSLSAAEQVVAPAVARHLIELGLSLLA